MRGANRVSKAEFAAREKELKYNLKAAEKSGKVSPEACSAQVKLGRHYMTTAERFDDASRVLEKAIQVCHKATGDSLDTASAIHGLATIRYVMGATFATVLLQRDQSFKNLQALLERCMAIRLSKLEANDVVLLQTRLDLARVYLVRREFDAARQQFEIAVPLLEAKYGPDSEELIRPLTGMGQLYAQEGNPAAEAILLRCVRMVEATAGSVTPRLIAPLETLMVLYHKQGRLAEAKAMQARAQAVRKQTIGNAVTLP